MTPSDPNPWRPQPAARHHDIPLVYWADIAACLDGADFIEDLLIDGGMSVVYGEPNSGKTFVMVDIALHVAAGLRWNGREVERGGVVWMAMEGSFGISNRVTAWRREHDIRYDIPFVVVPAALDLLDPDGDTEPLIRAIRDAERRLGVPVRLIVIDTLSRAIAGGNENAPDDMGALVANGTRLQQELKAHVCWIHHSGKDAARGARGHSLLRAAADTEIEISFEGTQRNVRVTKQRELDCNGAFSFTLRVVELGINKRGKPVTSCVVDGLGTSQMASTSAAPGLRGHAGRAMDSLYDLLAECGATGSPGVPPGCASVPEEMWRQRFYDRTISDGNEDVKQDAKRRAFVRAAHDLQSRRLVGANRGRVWVIRPGHETGQKAGQNG